MKITLLTGERIRLNDEGGPLAIEAESPEQSFSPFHMLAAALASCVYSVLHSWASSAEIPVDDLAIEIGWRFAEDPYRVGSYEVDVIWPSLPAERGAAAERAAHLCTVHQTLLNPPEIKTRVIAS